MKLSCKVRGKPLPMVAWQIVDSARSTTEVKAKDDKLEVESILSLDSIILEDESDEYKIVAANSYGNIEHPFSLTVNQLPSFTYIPEELDLIHGQQGVIECRASRKPLPNITWAKGRKDIDNSLSEQTGAEAIGKIVIASVTDDDAGKYTVKAKNSAGSVKEDIPVNGK